MYYLGYKYVFVVISWQSVILTNLATCLSWHWEYGLVDNDFH